MKSPKRGPEEIPLVLIASWKVRNYRGKLCSRLIFNVQGGSNMTETDLCVKTSQFVPVIFEAPCTSSVRKGDDVTTFIVPSVKEIQEPYPPGTPTAFPGL